MFILQHELKRSMLSDEERKTKEQDEDEKLKRAYADIPETKIISQAYYLKEQMLPRIAEKRGEDSEDYQFYFSLLKSLMYMLAVLGRDYRIRHQLSNEKLMREFYQNKCTFYESELMKYTTIENLITSESAQEIMRMFMKNLSTQL